MIYVRHTLRSGVRQVDKILKKLFSLMFYSNVHENALNRIDTLMFHLSEKYRFYYV